MEDDKSKVKKRVLPQWMREDKADTKKLFKKEVKRKKDRSPRKCTVYCMNEKELVDYALEILSKSKKERDNETETEAAIEGDKMKICEGRSEEPQTSTKASHSSKLTSSPPKDLTNSTALNESQSDDEDDPLKYVREIFFS
ncbi:cell cycle regulator of non-homologous end joining isoform 1-T2 [Mantella aurantiaca]